MDSNFTCTSSVEQGPWFLIDVLSSTVLLGIITKQVTKMSELMEEVIVGFFLLAMFPNVDTLMGDWGSLRQI